MPIYYLHSPFQTFINLVALVALAVGLAAFGISLRGFLQAIDNRDDISALETEACFSDLECANATLGNQCLNAFCGSNGLCQTNLTFGAECAFSSQCMEGFCNEECMCETQCSSDLECAGETLGNPCLNASCVSGICEVNLPSGAECAFSTQCMEGFCNGECLCKPQCSSDLECAGETLGNPCLEASCVNATCVVELLSGAMCAFSTSCSSGFCNDQCICSTVNGTIQCSDDLQCANATLGNPCLDAFCVDGSCQTDLTSGAECAFSTQCSGGNSVCNDQCMCSQQNISGFTCSSDPECDFLTLGNPCLNASCVDGQCQTNLTSGSECAFSSECTSGTCSNTCQCVSSSTPTAVPYDPTVQNSPNESENAIDYNDLGFKRFFYTEFSNYVRISFSLEARGNSSASATASVMIFDLPSGLDSNTSGFYAGVISLEPSAAISSGLETIIMTGIGSISFSDSTTGSGIIRNQNPDYVGPNLNIFNTISGWFEYEKL